MNQHLNIVVSGRVQRVWYRATTKQKALEFGIKGFVKNRINGSVYIEAEGSPEQLKLFVNWCKNGPQLAHVDEIDTQKGVLKNFTTFEIQ